MANVYVLEIQPHTHRHTDAHTHIHASYTSEQCRDTELMLDNRNYANSPTGDREINVSPSEQGRGEYKELYFDNLITSCADIALSLAD